jgi:hypothetical protein
VSPIEEFPFMRRTPLVLATTTLALAATAATAEAAPRVHDADAELRPGGLLHLEAETSMSARRVTFRIDGRSIRARLDDIDREDRTRDWDRTVRAGGVTTGRQRLSVRACNRRGQCRTVSMRVFVERDD